MNALLLVIGTTAWLVLLAHGYWLLALVVVAIVTALLRKPT